MLTVEQAQARVDALTTEAAALEASLLELEAQKVTLDKDLDSAYIVAERDPNKDHERTAVQLESRSNLHNNQVRRKRVALEACKSDLAEARTNLERAQRAAIVMTIEGFYTELVDMAAKLDTNPLQEALWHRLAEVCEQGNRLYRQVRPPDTHAGRVIFPEHGHVVNRVIQRIAATLGNATDLRNAQQRKIEFATVAAAMDLTQMGQEIAYLHRLHITPLEQQGAALELVTV